MIYQVSLSLGEGVSEVFLGVVVVVKANFDLASRGLAQLSYFIQEVRIVFLNGVKEGLLGRMSRVISE
jgi:hypothetical protein